MIANSQCITFNKSLKMSLHISLLVAFIDFMGVGLIYPLFATMLFDDTLPLLPMGTSNEVRGIWLGVLLALMPLAQFFSSPIWGAISDSKGRKTPLQLSIGLGMVGYLLAFCGIIFSHIWLLLMSRLVIGFASGNMSIVQATIADLSTKEEKIKNFGLYSMALGAGFTLGPFFGGTLSSLGYSIPFLFAFILTLLNLSFAIFFFKETNHTPLKKTLNWSLGIDHLKKAFAFKGLRTILLCSFLHNFGWSYFFEFIPVYLISEYQFSSLALGVFYGTAGCFYALSTGLFIRPLVKRFSPETLFFAGNFLAALSILTIPFLPASLWIWPLLILICYFVSFVTPSSTTLVSNNANSQMQGEALGILSSVNAAALVFSPLFSGSIVGSHPELPMKIGGLTLLMGACLLLMIFRKRLFKLSKESPVGQEL
jgi:MFS transporter, DHA1 family, tetracycline resistance protein